MNDCTAPSSFLDLLKNNTRAVTLLAFVSLLSTAAYATDGSDRSEGAELASALEIVSLIADEGGTSSEKLEQIAASWHPGYAVMLLELLQLARDPNLGVSLLSAMEEGTGQKLGRDIHGWYEWIWNQPYRPHPEYAEFKSLLYRHIDPLFAEYFSNDRQATIRLDEVRWGGVWQDGIPPLRSPKMIAAKDAGYLKNDHVVFGVDVNGDARAYPKRILAWHEMFVDEVGGVPVAGVYCTLCGTVILYETELAGQSYDLGTSGFLYRSNKLMYDQATQSLWNTIWGRPVIGPLVAKEGDPPIELVSGSVVTTTWGEWHRRHPDTQVLSLDTGHERDYSEGAAYREYFASDRLMFNVPKLDRRLDNKAEVLTLFPQADASALAISADFLAKKKNSIYHDQHGGRPFVVLTDRSGANRVYETEGLSFSSWDRDHNVEDENGVLWVLSESELVASDGRSLARLPAQRAFWFGWYAAFPDTRLVK